MVLVQLRVHGADLALPIGVIERAVDGGRRNAEPRCGHAINNQRDRQTAGLLVGSHIGKLGQLLSSCLQADWSTGSTRFASGSSNVLLILCAAYAVVHRDVLHRLHIKLDALHRFETGLQPANHVGGA